MRRLLALLVALGFALAPAGCGDDGGQGEVSDTLGGQGDADAQRLGDYLEVVRPLSTTDAAIIRALRDDDRKAATQQIKKLRRMHTESGEVARGFAGDRLRRFFVNYSDRIGDIAGAYQRVMDAPVDTDPATVARLAREIRHAKKTFKRLDDRLLATVSEALPREQQDRLQQTSRSLTEPFEDGATP